MGVGPHNRVRAGSMPRSDMLGPAAIFGETARMLKESVLSERIRWSLWLPVALGVGIGVYFRLSAEPPYWIAPVLLVLSIGFAALTARASKMWQAAILAGLSAILLGFAVAKFRTERVAAPHLTRSVGPVRMEGRIVSAEARGDGMRAVIAVTSLPRLAPDEIPGRVRVTFRRPDALLAPGQLIGLTAMLLPPPSPAAPGDYDFGRWAYFQQIGAVGYAYGGPRALDDGPAANFASRLSARLETLRAAMTSRIRSVLSGSTGGIAAAMITGDRGGIDESDNEAFRDSGLFHVLSISGLHLALAGGFFFWLVRAALALFPSMALRYPIKKWAAFAALAGAGFYLAISGGNPPAVRSYIMLAIMLLAIVFDRPALTMRAVALAAAILLLWKPEGLLDPGFQMSFAAVTALVAFGEWELNRTARIVQHDKSWMRWILRRARGIAVASVVAGIATAPFAIYHFDPSAQFGVLANLAAMPVVGLVVMPAATAAMVLMPFGLDEWPLRLMGQGIEWMLAIAHWVAGLPGAAAVLAVWPDAALLLVVAGGLWLTLWQRNWRWVGLAPIFLGLVLVQVARGPDVLIAQDGLTVAVRMQSGAFAFVRVPADEFSASSWLLRDGDARTLQQAVATGDDDIRCDSYGCVATTAENFTIASALRVEALEDDCMLADIVVSAVPVRRACNAPLLVIDRFDLADNGAYSVTIGDVLDVRSTEQMRGTRPWSMRTPQ